VRGTSEVAQAKRRKKVMDAAVGLAAKGGLEGLRIRDLVASTGVSSATIYRYFASKEHLLVAALAEQRFALRRPDGAPPDGATPAERVITLLRAPTDALTRTPRLAAAMVQAMTSGEPGVAPLLASLTEPFVAETAYAIRPGHPHPPTTNSPAPSNASGSPPSSAGSPPTRRPTPSTTPSKPPPTNSSTGPRPRIPGRRQPDHARARRFTRHPP